MTFFPELQYRFPIVTPCGTATIDFPETQWDIAAQAVITGPGAATVMDYLTVHGIGFYGHLFTLDAVSPMDLHHALTMNATTHKDISIFRFDVIGYVPEENPPENDPERWGDEEEDSEEEISGMVMEAAEEMILESSIAATIDGYVYALKQHLVSGKSFRREDIFAIYDNTPKVIGHVPVEISKALKLASPFVFCGLAFFIDHHINNHPGTPLVKYKTIDDVLSSPDEVRQDTKAGKSGTFAFIKAYDNIHCVVIDASLVSGKLILYKTFFAQKRKPYQSMPLVWPLSVSEEGDISSIEPAAIADDPAGNRLSGLSDTPDNLNIPSSSSEVNKEDIVTESATFDYRTAIQQATSFDDIKTAFQMAFPIIIPSNLPAKASGISLLDSGKGKPNTVYRDIYDLYTNEHLDIISEPYDGTLESLMTAWETVQLRLNDYQNASNSNSPIAATDANGRAKYYISPNGRFITDLQTGEEINTDAYKERFEKKSLQAQGFTVDTNIDGAVISLRLSGNIALRNRVGVWKLYEGEVNEKNLAGEDFTLQEIVTEMKRGNDHIVGATEMVKGSRVNSLGQPVAQTEDGIRSFWQWFSDSKVVDETGKPLMVYHGTDYLFHKFDGATMQDDGFFFTPHQRIAKTYGQNQLSVYLKVRNPLETSAKDWVNGVTASIEKAQEQGYDGYIIRGDKNVSGLRTDTYVAFFPAQIKSAAGNNLSFDSNNQSILESALTAEEVENIAHQAATSHKNDLPEPTEAQAKAGNYKHAHLKLHGLDITIENPKGSERSGMDPDGKPWSCTLSAHYGFLKRTTGADGEHVDVYIGESPESEQVFVVDQMDLMTGCFDEHKCCLATLDKEEAYKVYVGGFSDGRGAERIGGITEMDMEEFKGWLAEGETTQPVGRITVPQI